MWDSFNGSLVPGNYSSIFSPNVEFRTPNIGMQMGMGMPPVPFAGMMNPMMGMGAGLIPLPYDTFQSSAAPLAKRSSSSILGTLGKVAMAVGAGVLLWKGGKGIGKLFKKKASKVAG